DWREDMQPDGGSDQSESKARHACHQRSGKCRGQINDKIDDRCIHRSAKLRRAPLYAWTFLFKAVLNEIETSVRASPLSPRANAHTCDIFRWRTYRFADSPICDQRKPPFNLALNANRSASLVDPSCIRKERAMNRLITWAIGGALLAAAAGLMIANAQQSSSPPFIAGGPPPPPKHGAARKQCPPVGRRGRSPPPPT